jgi:hypothetical protein
MRYILVKNCCRFLLLAGGSCDNLSLVLFSMWYLSVLGEKTVRCVELLACPRQPLFPLRCGVCVGTCLMGM